MREKVKNEIFTDRRKFSPAKIIISRRSFIVNHVRYYTIITITIDAFSYVCPIGPLIRTYRSRTRGGSSAEEVSQYFRVPSRS